MRGDDPLDMVAYSIAEAVWLEGRIDGVVGRLLNSCEIRPRVGYLPGCAIADAGRLGGREGGRIASAARLFFLGEEESVLGDEESALRLRGVGAFAGPSYSG